MNFLIDENLPAGLSLTARQYGHKAEWVRDIQAGTSDQDIFENILKKDQTVVTRDKRFANYVLYQMMIEKANK